MGLFDKGVSRSGKGLFSSGDGSLDSDQLQRQIDNAQLRVQDAGFNVEDSDKRNSFEKFTNLPENQNWFLDTLELLGRGGNAVKNVVDKSLIKGREDFGTALYRGASGKEKVNGVDLAKQLGIDNKYGQFIAGTALDIGLDPTTYIPGGVIAKGVGAAVKPVAGIAKAGLNAFEEAAPAFKTFRETKINPVFDSAKDSLGYMFNPQYKQKQTLFGEENDALQNLYKETENSRQFMKENNMTNLADIAKSAGGIDTGADVGRLMEKDLQMIGPRPNRELSDNPQVVKAAEDLMKSNADLRQYALDNGIEIPEMAGYMTHILSKEERARRSAEKTHLVDKGQFNAGNPNKSILNARKVPGSAEDVNDQLGKTFFEPNAYFATGIGQQRLIDYIHAAGFRRKVLSNPDFAVKYDEFAATGQKLPKDAAIIDSNNYKFLKEDGDVLDGLPLKDEVGGKYVVTRAAKELLDRYQRVNTDEGTKAFIKAFDAVQGTWKKLALFSPGFHIRNAAGAMWNNYLAGMNSVQVAKYTGEAAAEVTNALKGAESELFREYRSQGLSSTSLSKVEYGRRGTEPEDAIQKTIQNRSKDTKGQVIQRLNPLNAFATSRELGDVGDQVNRFALYKFARDKGKSPEEAAAQVVETHFDYTNLTGFEEKARRVIPFYAWMRNNIPYQIKKLIDNPRKFGNINKIRLNAQDASGLNDENMPEYMKEQFNIPVYGSGGVGSSLGLNLPLTDLTKLSSPLKTFTDALTPLLKTPIELGTNNNMFLGKPIKKFEGQTKQFELGGMGFDLPIKAAYAAEQLGGQIGRGMSQYLQKTGQEDQDTKFRVPSMGISSVVKPFDAEKAKQLETLQRLKALQDYLLYIQQQTGEKPRTVNEIRR